MSGTKKLSNFLNTSLTDALDSTGIIHLMSLGETAIPLDSGTSGDYVKTLVAGKGINLADSQGHGVNSVITVDSAEVAYLTSTQTLTNKTINLTNNTLRGTRAQLQSSMSDDNFVTEAGEETLTNKKITAPIINLNAANSQTGTVGITGPGSITRISTFGLRDTTTTNYQTLLQSTSSTALTADRTLTIDVVNADRTLKLDGSLGVTGGTTVNIDVDVDVDITFPTIINNAITLVGTEDTIARSKALDSAQNFSLSGDITAPAVAFNGTDSVELVTTIGSGKIYNANINASAAIADTKLATISTAGKVANSATTATDSNVANTIVLRDSDGNFNAGTVEAYQLKVAGFGTVVDSAGIWVGSTEGVKGDKGEVGAKGVKGEVGGTGDKGQKGEAGTAGAAASKGQKGEAGSAGADGADGTDGTNGTNGDKGQKGEAGAAGSDGTDGTKGEPGVGDKGQKGEAGAAGSDGAAGGAGADGQKGEKGSGAEAYTLTSAPASANDGDLWFDDETGALYIYYVDANSSQWIQFNNSVVADGSINSDKLAASVVIKIYNSSGTALKTLHGAGN